MHSPRERFHTYLQTMDIERGALPEEFHQRLLRVLRHYGVESLDRTRELDNAVFRVFLAQQRSAPDVQLVMALLQQWMNEPVPADPALAAAAREVLDRLVLATQLRFPIVGDLARSVRFRWFDQPLVDAERAAVLASVREQVELLADQPEAEDRAERIDALAAIPEQIVRFLLERLENGMPVDRADARGAHPPALPRVRAGPPAGRPPSTSGRSPSPTTSSTTGRRTSSRPSARSAS